MALGTILPFWPALLFTYIEPACLITGFFTATQSPHSFVSAQYPTSTTPPLPPSTLILTHTLSNIFLLLAGLAIICTVITREARVAKSFLGMLAVADLGHIYASYRVMGDGVFWDFAGYNDVMWGNMGFSLFLHVNRLLTLVGVFGAVGRR